MSCYTSQSLHTTCTYNVFLNIAEILVLVGGAVPPAQAVPARNRMSAKQFTREYPRNLVTSGITNFFSIKRLKFTLMGLS